MCPLNCPELQLQASLIFHTQSFNPPTLSILHLKLYSVSIVKSLEKCSYVDAEEKQNSYCLRFIN